MSPGERARILAQLAELLPEDWLRRWFPQREPETLRKLLREAAGTFSPQDPEKSPAPAVIIDADRPIPSASPPATTNAGHCRLFTDGAARGNPGPAGAGWVILDEQGRELASEGIFLGHHTNNVAEYQALLAGLAEARRLGCRRLAIRLDSELIVRQLQGRYQVKHPSLKPLYQKALARLAGFEAWEVAHIPREQNRRADALANQGIDNRSLLPGKV